MRRRYAIGLLFVGACTLDARCDPSFSCSGTTYEQGDASMHDRDAALPLCEGCPIVSVAAGAEHTCVQRDEGEDRVRVECWGRNTEGQVDSRPGPDGHRPRALFFASGPESSLDAGTLHTCLSQPTVAVCWGENAAGALGGLLADQHVSNPLILFGGFEIRALRLGSAHACAVDDLGLAGCFGDNALAQLGPLPNEYRTLPVPIETLDPIATLDAGGARTCAIEVEGGVVCWGGGSADIARVAGTAEPTAISVGADHACVIDGGRARCFGDDSYGQLGRGAGSGRSDDAVTVSLDEDIDHLSAGGFVPVTIPSRVEIEYGDPSPAHTCAVTAAAELYCWGANDAGQLGVGTLEGSAVPVRVPLEGVEQVSAGGRHTCAIAAGDLYCWGDNTRGQLGTDPTELPLSADPIRVSLP